MSKELQFNSLGVSKPVCLEFFLKSGTKMGLHDLKMGSMISRLWDLNCFSFASTVDGMNCWRTS